ncbi:hypothetical protein JCM5296_001916 [Sporobolomyces johnsonii]
MPPPHSPRPATALSKPARQANWTGSPMERPSRLATSRMRPGTPGGVRRRRAGGLLWSVSDHVQAKRKGGDNEAAYGELWMFDRQAKGAMHDHEPERCRVAALCLPSLLNRCAAVIKTYVADAPLRSKMPFPRIRQEELAYVLQKLLATRLREGTLWASAQPEPSNAVASPLLRLDASLALPALVRSTLLRSPLAHLYELHPLFIALLSLSSSSPSIVFAYVPYRRIVGIRDDSGEEPSLEDLPTGFQVKRIGRLSTAGAGEEPEGDVVKLVLACLAKVGDEIGAGGSF